MASSDVLVQLRMGLLHWVQRLHPMPVVLTDFMDDGFRASFPRFLDSFGIFWNLLDFNGWFIENKA